MRGVVDPVPVHLMGGTDRAGARRRYWRARRLARGRRGVVAVVGTLLSLLVFFALFGIFITQYVPLWMTDNESQFTSQAAGSFAQFKQGVDLQYTLDGPPTFGTSFTISSGGVPLFAQPTEGTLVFLPSTCPNGFYTSSTASSPAALGQPVTPSYCVFENLTLSNGPPAQGVPTGIFFSQHVASGVLEMSLPNRYYTPQTFYFEDDAVIQSQGGSQQLMLLPPPLNVTSAGGNTSVAASFLALYGNASTVIGLGSQQVYSHLRFAQTVTSRGVTAPNQGPLFNMTFEIGTQYPCAWQQYLRPMMTASGVPFWSTGSAAPHTSYFNWTISLTKLAAETIPVSASACYSASGTTTVLTLRLTNVNFATVFYAAAQLNLGIGGT